MIYDCVLFFKELELLELRFNILNDVVDVFCICESDKTFTGITKPYYFEENIQRFSRFKNKILYKKITFENFTNPWANEHFQRNESIHGNFLDDDIILLSDMDEIPNPDILSNIQIQDNDILHFKQHLYYYNLNTKLEQDWYGTRAFKKSVLNQHTPTQIRHLETKNIIQDGGWHFSYFGNKNFIEEKLNSFSHTEFNNSFYKSNIEQSIKNKKDLFNRDITFLDVEISNNHHPEFIVNNQDSSLVKQFIVS